MLLLNSALLFVCFTAIQIMQIEPVQTGSLLNDSANPLQLVSKDVNFNFQQYYINFEDGNLARKMHSRIEDFKKVLSELPGLKLMLKTLLSEENSGPNITNTANSTTTAAFISTTTAASISNITNMPDLSCPSPALFLADRDAIYLFNSTASIVPEKKIITDFELQALLVDRSGKNVYVLVGMLEIFVFNRKTCSDEFIQTNLMLLNISTPIMILDHSERYFLLPDITKLNGKIVAYQIMEGENINETSRVVPNGPKCTIRNIFLYPQIENIVVVSLIDVSPGRIIFFMFDSSSGTLKELNVVATVPNEIESVSMIAFSTNGEYMYAVNDKNYLCIFKITVDKSGNVIENVTFLTGTWATVTKGGGDISANIIKSNSKRNHLYISNASPLSITTFETTNDKVKLVKTYSKLEFEITDFVVDKKGEKLIVFNKNNGITVYKISADGELTQESQTVVKNGFAMWYNK